MMLRVQPDAVRRCAGRTLSARGTQPDPSQHTNHTAHDTCPVSCRRHGRAEIFPSCTGVAMPASCESICDVFRTQCRSTDGCTEPHENRSPASCPAGGCRVAAERPKKPGWHAMSCSSVHLNAECVPSALRPHFRTPQSSRAAAGGPAADPCRAAVHPRL